MTSAFLLMELCGDLNLFSRSFMFLLLLARCFADASRDIVAFHSENMDRPPDYIILFIDVSSLVALMGLELA